MVPARAPVIWFRRSSPIASAALVLSGIARARYKLPMEVSSDQLRAARALLRLEQTEVAKCADVSVVTLRRLEGGSAQPSSATVNSVRAALERAGAEFIPDGVRRRQVAVPDADALYEDLRAISLRAAERLADHDGLMQADLCDKDGLPA
jgi:transcriptional regulator with XRE-family HTH domain